MKWSLIFAFLMSVSVARADDVIDLGGLEVSGELRQPPVRFYQPPGVPEDALQKVSEKHFEQFEAELLKARSAARDTRVDNAEASKEEKL